MCKIQCWQEKNVFLGSFFAKNEYLRWCAAMLRLKKSGQVFAKWTTVSECISLMWEERVADCFSGSIWTVFIQWGVHSSGTSETSDINFLQDKGYHSNRSHWPQANGADTCPRRLRPEKAFQWGMAAHPSSTHSNHSNTPCIAVGHQDCVHKIILREERQ